MAIVIKCKLEDVEKALADAPKDHRLVAVHTYEAPDPKEYADWKRRDKKRIAEEKKLGREPGLSMCMNLPANYYWRDMYFEKVAAHAGTGDDPYKAQLREFFPGACGECGSIHGHLSSCKLRPR